MPRLFFLKKVGLSQVQTIFYIKTHGGMCSSILAIRTSCTPNTSRPKRLFTNPCVRLTTVSEHSRYATLTIT